ncbi:PRC-barrel domain-containing protein [Candidatus Saccharibacteria bacterium]|nr:PRC-barrel domain-containing protein [Candidatus Saccharibacteria bacterium]
MLVMNSRLLGAPVLSVQAGGPIGRIVDAIIDPDNLSVIAFHIDGPPINKQQNILDVRSVREYSSYGFVIDDIDELVSPDDVIRINNILKLNFNLLSLKVETKKGSKLGKVQDFTLTSEDFIIQQIIVKRPMIKSLNDPELTIPRNEIVEITDYKIIVKEEEKTIKKKAEKQEFVPNFVNPFRESQPGFAPADTKTPDAQDN